MKACVIVLRIVIGEQVGWDRLCQGFSPVTITAEHSCYIGQSRAIITITQCCMLDTLSNVFAHMQSRVASVVNRAGRSIRAVRLLGLRLNRKKAYTEFSLCVQRVHFD